MEYGAIRFKQNPFSSSKCLRPGGELHPFLHRFGQYHSKIHVQYLFTVLCLLRADQLSMNCTSQNSAVNYTLHFVISNRFYAKQIKMYLYGYGIIIVDMVLAFRTFNFYFLLSVMHPLGAVSCRQVCDNMIQ